MLGEGPAPFGWDDQIFKWEDYHGAFKTPKLTEKNCRDLVIKLLEAAGINPESHIKTVESEPGQIDTEEAESAQVDTEEAESAQVNTEEVESVQVEAVETESVQIRNLEVEQQSVSRSEYMSNVATDNLSTHPQAQPEFKGKPASDDKATGSNSEVASNLQTNLKPKHKFVQKVHKTRSKMSKKYT